MIALPPHNTAHLDGRVAVAQIGRDALDVADVVQRQLRHALVHLEQQRERLADAAGSAQHRDALALDHGQRARGAAGRALDRRRGGDAAAGERARLARGESHRVFGRLCVLCAVATYKQRVCVAL